MTATQGSACFHCGEPIPAGIRIFARIDAQERAVCCHGCKAVAEFITGAGLDDYYRYRDQSAARANELPRPDRWSAYDRPELVERLTRSEPGGARSITVLLEGLRCSACSWLADRALHLQSGVLDVSVNPATARARLVWNPDKCRLGDLLRVLDSVGLRPHPLAGEPAEQLALLERRTALKRLAVAGFGMMQVMMFALPLYVAHSSGMDPGMREFFRLVSMLVSIPVALYSGWPFYQGAWHALRARSVSMDVPVTIGIVIAFVASVWSALTGHGEVYFDSVTMFVFFLSLGRYVEMVARHRAGSVADALARLAPVTARRLRAAQTEDVQAIDLQPGDEMLVRTGEIFAADGVVAEDVEGRVDESMLTGESTAIAKGRGATVRAGTQNLGVPLRVQVTAVAGATVLSGIVALLERAQAERPRLARAADRAAAWFLSRILVGAALVFAAWWFVDPAQALPATIAVLVVTCPCALSLATPAVLAAATADLAKRGVLVAHSDAFETLARATHVLWDKTGTLTRGLVRVEEIQPLRGDTPEACFALAAALEQRSEHPIAKAFAASGIAQHTAGDVVVTAGSGVEGTVDGRRLRIGTREFAAGLAANGDVHDAQSSSGSIFLGDAGGLLASFRLTDPLRSEAASCVQQLQQLGLASAIVSGDEASAVTRIAERSGIARFDARLTPQAKVERLQALQAEGAVVIAIGDGINDAPLLKGADVAIAMGGGSALAQTSADLILVRDSLDQLPGVVQIARRAQRIVRQNLGWSIAYNLAALPLAALGLVPAWVAAIGMSLSSVFVVLNAMRVAQRAPAGAPPHWVDARPAGAG
ncbi:MAG: heavy metal translocating P-type ATPase metal-binding domain-containing protein [Gammaproteobacteria bacterium]|nr:heavy metal translocating P-type ATPase metal-binding domain-containing protein [Gammaproteobacteria bacterium]